MRVGPQAGASLRRGGRALETATQTPDLGSRSTERLRTIWHRDLVSLEALGPAWRVLEHRADERTVHGSFDWMFSWFRHLSPLYGDALAVTVWDGQDLLGIAPLSLWNGTMGRVPVRRVDLAGHNCEQGEVLLAAGRADARLALCRAVLSLQGIHVTVFTGVEPGSAQERGILDVARDQGRKVEVLEYCYAVVDLSRGHAAYVARMSGNFRHNLRRHYERMSLAGPVAIDRLRGFCTPEEVRRYVDRIGNISARSWKATVSPPNPAHHAFYSEVAERFAARGMLDITILRVRGRDAAFIFALREGDRWFDGSISYAEEFADLSPGTYLMHRLLEDLAKEGVKLVVSHGDHKYKLRWTNQLVWNKRLFVFGPGLRPRMARLMRFELPRRFAFMRPRTDAIPKPARQGPRAT